QVGLERSALALAGAGILRPAVDDLPADDAARLLHQAQDRLHGDALAAATLADDANDFTGVQVEADAVDRLDNALVELEVGLEVADREHGFPRARAAKAGGRLFWPGGRHGVGRRDGR